MPASNTETPTEEERTELEESADAERVEGLILSMTDEARRGDLDAEVTAALLRHHADRLDAEGFRLDGEGDGEVDTLSGLTVA